MSFTKKFAANRLGVLDYKGTWDASSNTPELLDGIGKKGNYYIVSVAGSYNIDGEGTWELGDWIIFSGENWQRLNTADGTVQNSEKGAPNGVATLDESGIISASQLPPSSAPVTSVNGLTGDVVIATGEAAIADSITDGVTNIAPSQNAVFDALQLKANTSDVVTSINSISPEENNVSINTDNVPEGDSNLYFVDSRAKEAAVVDSISGNETDQAPSVSSIKSYVNTSVASIGFGKRYNQFTSSTVETSTSEYVSISQLTSPDLPSGLYKFKFWGLMQSASATNGVGVRINGTDATITSCFAFWNISQAADGTNSTFSYDQTSLSTDVVSQSTPAANSNFLVTGDGIFRVTVPGIISIQMRSEGSTTVRMMSDSCFSIDLISAS